MPDGTDEGHRRQPTSASAAASSATSHQTWPKPLRAKHDNGITPEVFRAAAIPSL
jgi:hypothetical protein